MRCLLSSYPTESFKMYLGTPQTTVGLKLRIDNALRENANLVEMIEFFTQSVKESISMARFKTRPKKGKKLKTPPCQEPNFPP